MIKEGLKVKDELDEMFGYTEDNYQLGIRDDVSIVCFDYGFRAGSRDSCVSNTLRDMLEYEFSGNYLSFIEYTYNRIL